MTGSFEFDERLSFSKNAKTQIEKILLFSFPGAKTVNEADIENDKRGTDVWLSRWFVASDDGKDIKIDVKIREKDFGKNDWALETWSVMKERVGWTLDETKDTDYVLFFCVDTGRHWLVNSSDLRSAFKENLTGWYNKYFHATQETTDPQTKRVLWKSEVVFVPEAVIKRAIQRQKELNWMKI